jgi:hypothetical protein
LSESKFQPIGPILLTQAQQGFPALFIERAVFIERKKQSLNENGTISLGASMTMTLEDDLHLREFRVQVAN